MADVVNWCFSTNDEIATFLYFPALTSPELLLGRAINDDKCIAIDDFHNLFGTKVKTQRAGQYHAHGFTLTIR